MFQCFVVLLAVTVGDIASSSLITDPSWDMFGRTFEPFQFATGQFWVVGYLVMESLSVDYSLLKLSLLAKTNTPFAVQCTLLQLTAALVRVQSSRLITANLGAQ